MTLALLPPERAELLAGYMRSPALQFVRVRTLDSPDKQYDALCDLLVSDVPLDQDARGVIAGALWELAHPAEAERVSNRHKVAIIKCALTELDRRGEKPEDAYTMVAKAFDHASGEALRKWIENHERLLIDDK